MLKTLPDPLCPSSWMEIKLIGIPKLPQTWYEDISEFLFDTWQVAIVNALIIKIKKWLFQNVFFFIF